MSHEDMAVPLEVCRLEGAGGIKKAWAWIARCTAGLGHAEHFGVVNMLAQEFDSVLAFVVKFERESQRRLC
jgi:hypothetical protein